MTTPADTHVPVEQQQDGIKLDADKVNRRLLDQLVAALAADPDKATERIGDALLAGAQWREAFDVQALDLAKAQAEVAALRDAAEPAGPSVVDAPDPT